MNIKKIMAACAAVILIASAPTVGNMPSLLSVTASAEEAAEYPTIVYKEDTIKILKVYRSTGLLWRR